MSYAEATGGAAASTAEKRYFCHQCHRTFNFSPSAAASGLACIHCHGDFVEEFDTLNPNPNPNPNPDINSSGRFTFDGYDDFDTDDIFADLSALREFVSFLRTIRSRGAGRSSDSSAGGDGGGSQGGRDEEDYSVQNPPTSAATGLEAVGGEPEPFDPVGYLLQLFENISNGNENSRGAGVQLMMDFVGGAGGEGALFGRRVGDYFIGPGLERLIEQLAENDPNRYGTPPASKNAVESLPDIKISEGLLPSDEAQCSVCMESFELGGTAKQMPCNHVYHKDCILPWLELHNSCPVCRYELPTDDPDYESRKVTLAGARNSSSSVASSAGGNGTAAETADDEGVERIDAIQRGFSFSRLFGLFGSDVEDSNPENAGGSDNTAPGAS